jgi:hypothetical protein
MAQFWLRKKKKKLNQNQINTQTSKKKKNSCIKIYIKKKGIEENLEPSTQEVQGK